MVATAAAAGKAEKSKVERRLSSIFGGRVHVWGIETSGLLPQMYRKASSGSHLASATRHI